LKEHIPFNGLLQLRCCSAKPFSGQRACGPASGGYLAAIAEGYRDFGFDDLAPLHEAQVEAITVARRAERATRFGGAALSPPWAPALAAELE
jgi:hypothetical protein